MTRGQQVSIPAEEEPDRTPSTTPSGNAASASQPSASQPSPDQREGSAATAAPSAGSATPSATASAAPSGSGNASSGESASIDGKLRVPTAPPTADISALTTAARGRDFAAIAEMFKNGPPEFKLPDNSVEVITAWSNALASQGSPLDQQVVQTVLKRFYSAPDARGQLLFELIHDYPLPQFRGDDFADSNHGYSFAVGQEATSGRITYQGMTVPFLYYNSLAGSRVGFLPPVDLQRDVDTARPVVFVADAKTGLPFRDGNGRPLTAIELVDAVQSGEIALDDGQLDLTIEFRFVNDNDIRLAVREAARRQLRRKFESLGEESGSESTPLLANEVAISDFRRVTISAEGPERVAFVLDDNPVLSERVRCSAVVPIRFLNRLLSPAGVSFKVEYDFLAVRQKITEVHSSEQVAAGTRTILNELGKGGLSTSGGFAVGDTRQQNHGRTHILLERKTALETIQRLQAQRNLVIVGQNPQKVNTLLKLLEDDCLRLAKMTAIDVDEFTRQQLDWKTKLEGTVGIQTESTGAATHDALTERERESFQRALSVLGKNSQLGLGLSIPSKLGPIGAVLGGGSSRQSADDRVQAETQFVRQFLRNLGTYRNGGVLPIPPELDLVLVSSQDIERAMLQSIVLAEPGRSRVQRVTTRFNSGVPTDGRATRLVP